MKLVVSHKRKRVNHMFIWTYLLRLDCFFIVVPEVGATYSATACIL